jgi:hypothetical protein
MQLKQLYLESIAHFPTHTQEFLLQEAPHAFLDHTTLPKELAYLGTKTSKYILDLGFENLGLNNNEQNKLLHALANHGIKLPELPYHLRTDQRGWLIVEPANNQEEAEFPNHWPQAIYIDSPEGTTWIGKKVRPDQIKFNHNNYTETPNGWMLNETPTL